MFLFCYSVRANSTENGAETSLIKSCKGRGCTCEKVERILPTQVQTLKTACILLCWRCRRKKCNCLQGQTKATRRSVIVGDRVNTKIATVIRAELWDGLDTFFPSFIRFIFLTPRASFPLFFFCLRQTWQMLLSHPERSLLATQHFSSDRARIN